jgi:hypothetical protein
MDDLNQILVSNLIEALQQLERYIVIGFGASVSALALTGKSRDRVQVASIPVSLARDTALLVLLALCVMVGAMASYSADSAQMIAERLHSSPGLLSAACTYPSVATSPYYGVRLLPAILPCVFLMFAIYRWEGARSAEKKFGPAVRNGSALKTLGVFAFVLVPVYGILALQLFQSACLSR